MMRGAPIHYHECEGCWFMYQCEEWHAQDTPSRATWHCADCAEGVTA